MTAEPVRLAIVGCGGMGRRHLAGLAELARCGERAVELVAVCDLNERNAHDLADEALALPTRGCTRIIAAAQRSGKILSVAENFRRDPMNHLVRALLDDGAIGDRQ